MYKHASLFILTASIHHANAGVIWGVSGGITMPIAKRYSTNDLIFDLRKGRSEQYMDTYGCQDFLVQPSLINRETSGLGNNLDFSQFDSSTDIAQLPAGTSPKEYHHRCSTSSYSSGSSLIGRDNQPSDYNNFDFLNNPNPFPVGESRIDPWADAKMGTNLEFDNFQTGTGAHDNPLPGQDLIANAQTGAYDVPAPLQDTLTVTSGQDIKLPSPGTDYTNIAYNAAYDTILPNQATDSNPTPNPSFEQQLANVQIPDIPCNIPNADSTVLKLLSMADGFKINCEGQVFLSIGEQSL